MICASFLLIYAGVECNVIQNVHTSPLIIIKRILKWHNKGSECWVELSQFIGNQTTILLNGFVAVTHGSCHLNVSTEHLAVDCVLCEPDCFLRKKKRRKKFWPFELHGIIKHQRISTALLQTSMYLTVQLDRSPPSLPMQRHAIVASVRPLR